MPDKSNSITVKSVPKSNPQERTRLQIDGKTFDYQELNSALSHVAQATGTLSYTVEVAALEDSPAPTSAV